MAFARHRTLCDATSVSEAVQGQITLIIDAKHVPQDTLLEADICIIGAGPAGISLAMEFDGQPFRVILLEAGALKRHRAAQAIYRGESVGLHYEDLDQARSRYFGGSSNCWGGFCRPLDPHDFERRDWVPNSGWPIKRAELMPYYQRAHCLLQLGPFEYDPPQWEEWINQEDARLLKLPGDRAINVISQLSPPTRFGREYRNDIADSPNVTAYLDANVTEIEAPETGARVTAVQVRSLAGHSFAVAAHTYILAAGGIETPRLLLASNRHQPAGVGNWNDVVGRYFMDHPRLLAGSIQFGDTRANSGIYDLHRAFQGDFTARGVKIAAYFGLRPETQRAERIGNTRCYAKSRYVADDPSTYTAVSHLRQALHGAGSVMERSRSDIVNVITHLPKVGVLAAGLKLRLPFLARGFALETIVEPTPLPDSRVELGDTLDRFGMPQVKVDWRLGELEKRTIRRTQQILGEDMVRAGAGTVVVGALDDGQEWPGPIRGCWHHMGTARMADDPRQGVVDAHCRVHGMENLFIAGSAVFPTCGADFPTITIVALALRLADHLKAQYAQRPRAEMGRLQETEPV
jgi:choline dehydrogenase-like flavoprotein